MFEDFFVRLKLNFQLLHIPHAEKNVFYREAVEGVITGDDRVGPASRNLLAIPQSSNALQKNRKKNNTIFGSFPCVLPRHGSAAHDLPHIIFVRRMLFLHFYSRRLKTFLTRQFCIVGPPFVGFFAWGPGWTQRCYPLDNWILQ